MSFTERFDVGSRSGLITGAQIPVSLFLLFQSRETIFGETVD